MRSRVSRLFGAFVLLSLLVACSTAPEAEKAEAPPPEPVKPPEVYRVKLETTKGDIIIEVHQEWAPRGADHFFELVHSKFYDNSRFFRVVRRYIAQFGINSDPKTQSLWAQMRIRDDPVKQSNKKGFVTFAKLGPASRTTQVFINLRDNEALDKDGFAPFGQVIEGMDIVERLWSSYGEVAPRGTGPDPTQIELQGDAYLEQQFPRLDKIVRATIITDTAETTAEQPSS